MKIGAQLTLAVKKKNAEPLVAVLTVPASGTENSASPLGGNVLQLATASDGSLVTFVYFGNNPNEEYVIEWAALYEGEYTTKTLPEYQPKGYENELLICKQYNPTTGEYIGLTPAFVGAAPAGYGLGGQAKEISDCHVAESGFYRWDVGCANAPFEFATMISVNRYGSGSSNRLALCGGGLYQGCIAHKVAEEEWEYLNPPMVPGVEYRTTERYEGKPVYAYHNVYTLESTLTGSQTLDISTGIVGMSECIRHSSKLGYYFLPFIDSQGNTAIYGVSNGVVQIHNAGNATWNAGYSLNYTLYYTKTN